MLPHSSESSFCSIFNILMPSGHHPCLDEYLFISAAFLITLRNRPNYNMKVPILRCNKAYIGDQNRLYCNAKWALLQNGLVFKNR